MIVENVIMWPNTCNRWRIDDDPRWPLDNLLYTVYTGAALKILVRPIEVLIEKPPIEFIDPKAETRIREKEVRPVLAAAFCAPLEAPWEVDKSGDLALGWDLLEDFFTNLVWCSRLRIPFVFDVNLLKSFTIRKRNDFLTSDRPFNPQILNGLIAIMSLYQEQDVWCLRPTEKGRGTPLEIWRQLRTEEAFKQLSRETRNLGLKRKENISEHISHIRYLATNTTSSHKGKAVLTTAKTVVSLFLGPVGDLAAGLATSLGGLVFGEPYVPPSLTDIEKSFDETFFPWRSQ
jgi:hypothetical protein